MPPPPSHATSLHEQASQILQLVTVITTKTLTAALTTASALTTYTNIPHSPTAAPQSMPTPLATPTTLSATTATPPAKPLLKPSESVLPDWPPILTIFLLSWLVMAWVVTVALFLASFPEKTAWLGRTLERMREWRRERSWSTLPRSADSIRLDPITPARPFESRDDPSTAVATGLGISFRALLSKPRLRRPRSFDEEAFKPRGWSWETSVVATAPLPSSRSFVGLPPVPLSSRRDGVGHWERGWTADLENSKRDVNGEDTWAENQKVTPQGAGGVAGVLESVQAVVEFIAERLAKMENDEVTGGAEEGLLLPVEDKHREPALS